MTNYLVEHWQELYKQAEALAASRLELLRECNNIMPACPKCKGNLRTWEKIDENKTIRIGHADNCELAKELGDDKETNDK